MSARSFGYGLLGAVIGAAAGAAIGLLAGIGYVELAAVSSAEGYSGYVAVLWMLCGLVLGLFAGIFKGISMARRASQRIQQ